MTTRDKHSQLHQLNQKKSSFFASPIYQTKDKQHPRNIDDRVMGTGNSDSPIMFIIGTVDKKSYLKRELIIPNQAKQLLKKVKLAPEDVYFTFSTFIYRGEHKISNKDIEISANQILENEINIIKPQYVVPLDSTAEKGIRAIPKNKLKAELVLLTQLNKIKLDMQEGYGQEQLEVLEKLPEKIVLESFDGGDELILRKHYDHKYQLALASTRRQMFRDQLERLKDIILVPRYVSIIGSFADGETNPNDLDFLIQTDERDFRFEKKLGRQLKEWLKPLVHLIMDSRGPQGSGIPIYDLVLRKRKSLRKIAGPNDIIEIRESFLAPKIIKNRQLNDLATEELIIEPYVQGQKIWAFKNNSDMEIFDRERNNVEIDNSLKEQLQSFSRNFLVEGIYKDSVLFLTDVLYHQTTNTTKLPLAERKTILSKIFNASRTPNIKVLKWEFCANKAERDLELRDRSISIIKYANEAYNDESNWFILRCGYNFSLINDWTQKLEEKINAQKK